MEQAAAPSGRPSVAVSVVVAVYNPGENLERLLASLATQTLAAEDLELVFVDDGSTDDSLARLRALAAERPGTVVETIPNSGWPGRPRNIGLGLARGEYVFFADHDDEFFPDALRRMHAVGQRDAADIVCPKLVTEGMHTPFWELAGRNLSHGDLVDDDLLIWRMTHKLFRREFLLEHGIRFPEGHAPLEDHLFMAPALPRAKSISLVADYPCYRWVLRNDGTNNSHELFRAPGYWDNFRTSLHLFADAAGPGRVADAGLAWAAGRMLHPLRPRGYRALGADERQEAVAPVIALARDEIPPRVDELVPVLKRLRVQALRAGDLATFDRVQEAVAAIEMDVRVDQVEWVGGRLQLSASAGLRWPVGTGLELARGDSGVELDLSAWEGASVGPRAPLRGSDLGSVALTVRHRASGVEWPLEASQDAGAGSYQDGSGLTATWSGTVDPWDGRFGQALDDGLWDVLVRAQFLGESRIHRLAVDDAPDGWLPSPDGTRRARASVTSRGTLAVKVGPVPVRPRAVAASWDGGTLVVRLESPDDDGARLVVRVRGGDDEHEADLTGAVARVDLPGRAGAGDLLDVSVRAADGTSTRVVHALADDATGPTWATYRTQNGSLSLRPPRPRAPEPPPGRGPAAALRGLRRLRARRADGVSDA